MTVGWAICACYVWAVVPWYHRGGVVGRCGRCDTAARLVTSADDETAARSAFHAKHGRYPEPIG